MSSTLKVHATARAERTLLATEKGSLVSRDVAEVQVSFEGFVGDKHSGLTRGSDVRQPWYPRGTPVFNTRQVSVVSSEELAEVAGLLGLPHVRAAWLGANLELSGVARLTQLPAGTRLFFPEDAVLVMDAENDPCTGPGKVVAAHFPDAPAGLPSRFVKAAWGRRGLVGFVERPGVVRAGDAVRVVLPRSVRYAVPANVVVPGVDPLRAGEPAPETTKRGPVGPALTE